MNKRDAERSPRCYSEPRGTRGRIATCERLEMRDEHGGAGLNWWRKGFGCGAKGKC